MLKNILLSAFLIAMSILVFAGGNKTAPILTPAKSPISHEIWNSLLKKHVGSDGFVNYKGFVKDGALLDEYIALLSSAHPQSSWPRDEQMAYWINAYNAFTIKLIVDNYPVKSIKDIKKGIPFVNTVWDIKFIEIQGETYDLNKIEHGILRKDFKDARIHAAVNCASYSCPKLRNEAFVASKLESQLEDSMRDFVNDPLRNRIRADKAEISQIFNWFSDDFKDDGSTIKSYINRYSKVKTKGKISYLDYDWSLNEAK